MPTIPSLIALETALNTYLVVPLSYQSRHSNQLTEPVVHVMAINGAYIPELPTRDINGGAISSVVDAIWVTNRISVTFGTTSLLKLALALASVCWVGCISNNPTHAEPEGMKEKLFPHEVDSALAVKVIQGIGEVVGIATEYGAVSSRPLSSFSASDTNDRIRTIAANWRSGRLSRRSPPIVATGARCSEGCSEYCRSDLHYWLMIAVSWW